MELEPMDTAELTAQQERYDAIARATSDSLALFYCCIEFDRPFDMLAVPKEPDVGEKWVAYLDNLRLKKAGHAAGRTPWFSGRADGHYQDFWRGAVRRGIYQSGGQ